MKKHGMDVELNTENLMVGGNFRSVVVATTQRFSLLSFRISISYTLSLFNKLPCRGILKLALMFALHGLYYLYFPNWVFKIGSDISSTQLVLIVFPRLGFLK